MKSPISIFASSFAHENRSLPNVWWTDRTISTKVTRDFIVSNINLTQRRFLFRPVFDGGDLTDDTYLDWMLRCAKRIFLTLLACEITEIIFGILDEGWTDDDLPLSRSEISHFIPPCKSRLDVMKQFHVHQYHFLLRPPVFDGHIDYEPHELVPVEYVPWKASAEPDLQQDLLFYFPDMPNVIYARHVAELGQGDEAQSKTRLLEDIQLAQSVQHDHIAPVLASWSKGGRTYVMTSFIGEHSLRSFLDASKPHSMRTFKEGERPRIMLEWTHCLAHALAHLHRMGITHGNICPPNILIDEDNVIAFADIGCAPSLRYNRPEDLSRKNRYLAPELFGETVTDDSKRAHSALSALTSPRNRLGQSIASKESDNAMDSTSKTSSGVRCYDICSSETNVSTPSMLEKPNPALSLDVQLSSSDLTSSYTSTSPISVRLREAIKLPIYILWVGFF